ncbi:DUF3488 and transglutaminase-like domain-containing protein [Modestobacter sp. NPDC049651]|uniref:transglutaminase family protein n=1 Tax=unclassified Modestobacter TaxID=2643866 RepID=UPI0033D55C2E
MTATLPPRATVRASATSAVHPDGRPAAGTAIAGGVAVVLGSLALDPVFAGRSWLPPVVTAVALVALSGAGLRALAARLDGPARALTRPLVPLVQLLLVFAMLTAGYAPEQAWAGVVPTWASTADLGHVLSTGVTAVNEQATPALPLTGLVALTTVFVALIALAVDLLVAARQPALGGLALLVVYCVPVSTITGHVPLVAFLAPACGLALLLWADQRSRLPASRAGAGSPLGTGTLAALRIGALALVAGVALPLVVPMLGEGSLAKGFGDGGGPASTGTKLDPVAELQGQLTQPDPVALLRVRSSVEDPGYLRAVALDDYTDGGWRMGRLDGDQSIAGPGLLQQPVDQGSYRSITETVQVVEHDDQFLPVPYGPLRVRMQGGGAAWRYDPDTGTIFGRGQTTAGKTYTVSAAEPTPSPEALAAAPEPSPGDRFTRRFTQVPPLAPEVTDLVDELTDPGQSPYERVMGIYDYLTDRSNGFTYSLSTSPGTSGDQLVDFLRNKRGYCEQYAGSMAVLVRAAGVPARVVLGYTAGEKRGDDRVISTSDAHAWVEAFFSGIGWVPFDPTPIADGRAATLAWAPRADSAQPMTSTPDTADAPAQEPAPAPAQLPEEQDYVPLPTAQAVQDETPTGWLVAAALTGVVLVLALTPALVRRRQRARRLAEGSPGALWDELLARLTDLGTPAAGTATPRQLGRELSERLGGSDPEVLPAVRTLATAEERSVYAPAAAADPDELRAALRTVLRSVGRAATRGQRVRAALAPASTLTAAAEWVAAHTPRRTRPAA